MSSVALAKDTGPCACSHCGLDVPLGLRSDSRAEQFCCTGCETAYSVIHAAGLDRYYAIREKIDGSNSLKNATARAFAEFDDPAFASLYCTPVRGGLAVDLMLEGVHCSACVWLIERLGRVVDGVIESPLDYRRHTTRVVFDPAKVKLSRVAAALDGLGYRPHPARGAKAREIDKADDRKWMVRLGVAGACFGNVMLLFFALYAGAFDGMDPVYARFFRWAAMLISTISLVWPGSVFFRGAWAALRTRTLTLDVPISIGLGAGLVWGIVRTVQDAVVTGSRGETVYFDTLAMLVFVILVGRYVQRRQQRWAADSVELLFCMTPTSARVIDDSGGVKDVSIQSLTIGQHVEIRPGDSVPVDGFIVEGASSVDQSLLTGESVPVGVRAGDRVCAGTLNVSGVLRVRVEATGESTRVGRLMRLVEEGTRTRAPIVRLADKLAGWFMVAVLALAAVTAAAWWSKDPGQAIDHAVALLVVTCPCGLGLATPLVMTVALGRAARRGLLVRSGEALEQLSHPSTLLLDKTGTLTRGKLELVCWMGDERVKPMVRAIETASSHPVARAFLAAIPDDSAIVTADITAESRGVIGRVGNRLLSVGAASWVREKAGVVAFDANAAEAEIVGRGLSPVFVAVDGVIVAAAGVGDRLREDARASLDRLRTDGWRTRMISGDHARVVEAVARELALTPSDARGAMTPDDKYAEVIRSKSSGAVVMVGDGVNDAPALAAASVGIAVHGGAEASLTAADVYLNREGVGEIVELMAGAQRAILAIKINIGVSIAYNIFAATLSVAGVISPLLAAIIMPISSLTVLALSVKARTFEEKA